MIDSSSLEPGERLLWRDKPDVNAYCNGRTSFKFSIGVALLAVGAALAAYQYVNGDAVSQFWALPALLGAALLYLPVRIRRDARRTSYALTDRRAIIERPGTLLRNRISVPLSEIRFVEVHHGISGDVLFREVTTQSEDGPQIQRDGFFAIAKVEEVERLLRSATEKATGKPLASATS